MTKRIDMKIFLSADIEGVAGITAWDEIRKTHADYQEFREQMTREVSAACRGAIESGAEEVWVKDAHGTGRNLITKELPRKVRLIRGWSGHPFSMMDRLDDSFAAVLMIGYHSASSSNESPLAHTMSGKAESIRMNGGLMSEFSLNAFTASMLNVPVVFISGDAGICESAQSLIPQIGTCATKIGVGNSTINYHPDEMVEKIERGVRESLAKDFSQCTRALPDLFDVEIKYKAHGDAYKASFYPGCEKVGAQVVQFKTDRYFEVLRLISFVM